MTLPLTGAGPGVPGAEAPLLTLADADLAFYYALDEASGSRADLGPAGLTLTEQNGVGSEAGILGTAATFVAANAELLYHNPDPAYYLVGDFTITAWVKLHSKTGNPATNGLVSNWNTGGNWIVSYEAVEDQFRIFVVDTPVYAATFGSPALETWYFVVVRRQTGNLEIGVNDGPMDSTLKAEDAIGAIHEFAVGGIAEAGPGAGDYFTDCAIAQVTKWDRALSDEELTWFYNSGAGRVLS